MKRDDKKLEAEVLQKLAVPENNGVLQGVLLLLDYQRSTEITAAIGPRLEAEERAYNAGRAAALEDYGHLLRTLHERAIAEPKK